MRDESGGKKYIWKSDTTGKNAVSYFLGIDCSHKFIGVYRGPPSNAEIFWSAETTKMVQGMSSPLETTTTIGSPETATAESPEKTTEVVATTKTKAPDTITTEPPAVCAPIYLGLKSGEVIQGGKAIQSPDDENILLKQWTNGNLIIKKGSKIIWESGKSEGYGLFWVTKLQGDGNLVTWKTTTGDWIWKSNSGSENSDYFLGLDCQHKYVAIYRGTPSNPDGTIVWKSPTY